MITSKIIVRNLTDMNIAMTQCNRYETRTKEDILFLKPKGRSKLFTFTKGLVRTNKKLSAQCKKCAKSCKDVLTCSGEMKDKKCSDIVINQLQCLGAGNKQGGKMKNQECMAIAFFRDFQYPSEKNQGNFKINLPWSGNFCLIPDRPFQIKVMKRQYSPKSRGAKLLRGLQRKVINANREGKKAAFREKYAKMAEARKKGASKKTPGEEDASGKVGAED